MDPDANLEEQRRLVRSLKAAIDNSENVDEGDIDRLIELVGALDEWISTGGPLPRAWETFEQNGIAYVRNVDFSNAPKEFGK